MKFYLGTCQPSWLNRTNVPLFLSRNSLIRQIAHGKAQGDWALDSGAFTEITKHARWTVSAKQYADEAMGWYNQIGPMDFAGIQDYMCEPHMLKQTGLSVEEHQVRTMESYFDLREQAPSIPWAPTLQGWSVDDYLHHYDMWESTGIKLHTQPTVAIGSVCRRQGMDEATDIIQRLASIIGLNIHAYGFKISGIKQVGSLLKSSDSMAWSLAARYDDPLPECKHRTCNNCLNYALEWRKKIIAINTDL